MTNQHAAKFIPKNAESQSVGRKTAPLQKGGLFAPHEAEARGNMYYFLASVYLGPLKPELVRFMIAKDFLQELGALFGENTVADLKQFAATVDLDKGIASLKQEYMDLFAVPTGRYVTPFEDVYLGKIPGEKRPFGPLMGHQAIAVQKMYRQAGTQMDPACKELPTHIGVELSFMNFLCEQEAAVISVKEECGLNFQGQTTVADSAGYRELQIKFLQEHLNAWFPQLSQMIQFKAKSKFYRGLALITEAFLAVDAADLLAQPD